MSEYAALYAERLTTAAEAVEIIPSGAKIAMALGAGQPPAVLKALADRAEAGRIEGAGIYYLLSTAIAGDTVFRYELLDRIKPYSLFHSAVERKLEARAAEEGRPNPVGFIPAGFQQAPRVLCEEVGVDTLVCAVSPMDAEGYFSFGVSTDYSKPVSDMARRVIVEVNPNMPRVFGDCRVHVSRVSAIVEHAVPLLEAGAPTPQPQDLAIGEIVAGLVEDGATLQMGIGALPNAVCDALKDHRDLGIHTEMLTPGLVELMRRGVVTNRKKAIHVGKTVFAFSMGDRATYDYMNENPDIEAYPVSYVNDPAVIAKNPKVVSVNATLQIDLHGACCSEFLNGRQFTAAGGQLDFVRGAVASPGGRSIIACHSTAAKGRASRIVPRLEGPVTTPRNDVQIVVTEHGWANLKGRTTQERARALIRLADPAFREELEREARAQGIL